MIVKYGTNNLHNLQQIKTKQINVMTSQKWSKTITAYVAKKINVIYKKSK